MPIFHSILRPCFNALMNNHNLTSRLNMAQSTSTLVSTKVLLIDGHDKDREYYADRLATEHFIFLTGNGQTGLDCFYANRIDCVILELDLPDVSGFEILLNLVPVADRPTIPVIVLTRLSNPVLIDLALKNGAQAGFYKGHTSGDTLGLAVRKAMAAFPRSGKEAETQRERVDWPDLQAAT